VNRACPDPWEPRGQHCPEATRLHTSEEEEKEEPGPRGNSKENPALALARPRGFEPLAFGFVGVPGLSVNPCSGMQMPVFTAFAPERWQQERQAEASKWKFLAAGLLHTKVTVSQQVPPAPAGVSVREAAERLGACQATVRSLCARGELAHRRERNVIRIDPVALDALIAARYALMGK